MFIPFQVFVFFSFFKFLFYQFPGGKDEDKDDVASDQWLYDSVTNLIINYAS